MVEQQPQIHRTRDQNPGEETPLSEPELRIPRGVPTRTAAALTATTISFCDVAPFASENGAGTHPRLAGSKSAALLGGGGCSDHASGPRHR